MTKNPSVSAPSAAGISTTVAGLMVPALTLPSPAKALVVGINDYAPAGPGGPDLNGCRNDALDFANTIQLLGVVPARAIRIMYDNGATRANILSGLDWLLSDAREGNLRIFYYAGHGSQIVNAPGGDLEPDSRDETICPHDYATAGMITDDELALGFSRIPAGVRLEVVFDSCHSGSSTRSLEEATIRSEATIRYVEPPLDHLFLLQTYSTLQRKGGLKSGARDLAPAAMNHVLWAACQDGQSAKELNVGGAVRGVFTYWFCKVLRKAGAGAVRSKIDSQVSQNVRNATTNQVPQLEGQRTAFGKPIFGATREAAGMAKAAAGTR